MVNTEHPTTTISRWVIASRCCYLIAALCIVLMALWPDMRGLALFIGGATALFNAVLAVRFGVELDREREQARRSSDKALRARAEELGEETKRFRSMYEKAKDKATMHADLSHQYRAELDALQGKLQAQESQKQEPQPVQKPAPVINRPRQSDQINAYCVGCYRQFRSRSANGDQAAKTYHQQRVNVADSLITCCDCGGGLAQGYYLVKLDQEAMA